MTRVLEVRRSERAFTVAFTRSDKRNALDVETSHALGEALDEAVEVQLPLVLRSATPGMFVSGTDVSTLTERTVDASLGRINARLFQRVADHPLPTVAVVEGWALGGGCELALACDFRITTADAKWGLPEVRLGLVPSGGALWRLPRLVGGSIAADLIMTGRRIEGLEAHRIGLAQRLAEPTAIESVLGDLLDDLSATVPQAVRLAKEAMLVEGDRSRLVDAAAQALCIASEEAQSRMAALLRD